MELPDGTQVCHGGHLDTFNIAHDPKTGLSRPTAFFDKRVMHVSDGRGSSRHSMNFVLALVLDAFGVPFWSFGIITQIVFVHTISSRSNVLLEKVFWGVRRTFVAESGNVDSPSHSNYQTSTNRGRALRATFLVCLPLCAPFIFQLSPRILVRIVLYISGKRRCSAFALHFQHLGVRSSQCESA